MGYDWGAGPCPPPEPRPYPPCGRGGGLAVVRYAQTDIYQCRECADEMNGIDNGAAGAEADGAEDDANAGQDTDSEEEHLGAKRRKVTPEEHCECMTGNGELCKVCVEEVDRADQSENVHDQESLRKERCKR